MRPRRTAFQSSLGLEGSAPAVQLYHRIANRKSNQIAAVAAARELVGFLWAVMRQLENEQANAGSAAA